MREGHTKRFEMNGRAYTTDAETLALLREIVPSAKATGDSSAVIAVMVLGEMAGRIAEDPGVTAALAQVSGGAGARRDGGAR